MSLSTEAQQALEVLQKSSKVASQLGGQGEVDVQPTGYISTRCPTLDYLIGKPGVPQGGITTFVGAYGTGKTSLCQHILAEVQSERGIGVMVDAEGRFSLTRAEHLGVNVKDLILIRPSTLEETFESVRKSIEAIRETSPDQKAVIVVDSVAGAGLEVDVKGAERSAPGSYARFLGSELRVLTGLVSRQKIALVITCQPKMKIEFGKWGRPGITWIGERAIGHASWMIIGLEEQGKIGEDPNSPVGFHVMATLMDTRIADKERKGWRRTFDFYSATGVDWFSSALDVLLEKKVVNFNGGWYRFGEGKPFRRAQFEEQMETVPELTEALHDILHGGEV